jgi:hypothetical protein
VLLFFFCVLHCSLFLYCTVSACDVRAATLTEFFLCFSSVVRQKPGYNSQRLGTTRTSQFFSFYCYVFSVLRILCTVCVYMCAVLLQPGVNPIAIKYILYHYLSSVHSVTIPLHISGLHLAHHQEVTMYICDTQLVLVVGFS